MKKKDQQRTFVQLGWVCLALSLALACTAPPARQLPPPEYETPQLPPFAPEGAGAAEGEGAPVPTPEASAPEPPPPPSDTAVPAAAEPASPVDGAGGGKAQEGAATGGQPAFTVAP